MGKGNWAGGSSAEWKKVRAAVLARDRYRCRLRTSRRCSGVATTVHHVQDRKVVGDDPAFLIAACGPCNYSYGSPLQDKYGDPPAQVRPWW